MAENFIYLASPFPSQISITRAWSATFFFVPNSPTFCLPQLRRVTNARGDFSSFSLPSAGMFLSNVDENIKLEGVEPQSASTKNWESRPLHLLLDAAAEGKKSGWSPRRTTATSEGAVLFSFGEGWVIISDQEEVKLSQLPTYREDIFIFVFVACRASIRCQDRQTDPPGWGREIWSSVCVHSSFL